MKWVLIIQVFAASGTLESEQVMDPDIGLGPSTQRQCELFAAYMGEVYSGESTAKFRKGKTAKMRCVRMIAK